MKKISFILVNLLLPLTMAANETDGVQMFPACGAEEVNVDTHLKLTFPDAVTVGSKG